MGETGPEVLRLEGITRDFGEGEARTQVLRGVDFTLRRGEFAALMGPSGSGKSTLLHIMGLLDRPTGGHVLLDGQDTGTMDDDQLTRCRGRTLGFVFQFHHLLPELTAEENVALPLFLAEVGEADARATAREVLSRVGLSTRSAAFPRTLSGGERQRVAMARAVVRRPRLLLCDEPTGSLDAAHAASVFALLLEVARERAGAAVVVTHDPEWAKRCATMKLLTPNGLTDV